MELLTKICTNHLCNLVISDETGISDTGYLPEDSTSIVINRFKFSDTMSIDILQHNKSSQPVLMTPIFTLHSETPVNITIPVNFDGWFNIFHIVIPTQNWFLTEQSKPTGSALDLYDTVYYSNGQEVYKYFNGEISTIDISEIVERNIEGTTISRISNDYVSICFLQKCYINLCQQIFNSKAFTNCWKKDTTSNELSYKRDLAWMAINVIKYMTQSNQLAEAERVIEQISTCNGLCKSEFNMWPNRGCGCSQR